MYQTAAPFQSTPSGGKATSCPVVAISHTSVSIHAFRGEGDHDATRTRRRFRRVSIHAFRGEGDPRRSGRLPSNPVFQSTPSGGKATFATAARSRNTPRCFNPRLPGGRRRAVPRRRFLLASRFNPRLPGGRRRAGLSSSKIAASFNPRLPGGRRPCNRMFYRAHRGFNPRLPGGRRPDEDVIALLNGVSIHAFRGEGDLRSP